jgi:DNA-binding PadR family transcriptional regulator
MSAKHALLGLLLPRPDYPYSLADRLQKLLGPAWAINSGQLSQTIKRLEKEGLIERIEGAVQGRQMYALKDKGVVECERWFEQEDMSEARLLRRPLLVKIALAGPDPERLTEVREQIRAYEHDCIARIGELAKEMEGIPPLGPQVRADHMLLRAALGGDISHLQAELKWARSTHRMLSWLESQDAIWPSARDRSGEANEEGRGRQDARQELFGRMAARHRGSISRRENRRP